MQHRCRLAAGLHLLQTVPMRLADGAARQAAAGGKQHCLLEGPCLAAFVLHSAGPSARSILCSAAAPGATA